MKTVWFAISSKSIYNPGYFKILNDSLWDTKKELKEWLKKMKKFHPHYTDYDKLKLKSAKVNDERTMELGSWLYHPRKGLIFARSQWQGD